MTINERDFYDDKIRMKVKANKISIKNIFFYNISFKIKLFFKESKLFLLYEKMYFRFYYIEDIGHKNGHKHNRRQTRKVH